MAQFRRVNSWLVARFKVLLDKFYGMMNEEKQRKLLETLIQEIQIYEERQPNGQWLKSITFRLAIIEEDMQISIESGLYTEDYYPVCLCGR